MNTFNRTKYKLKEKDIFKSRSKYEKNFNNNKK